MRTHPEADDGRTAQLAPIGEDDVTTSKPDPGLVVVFTAGRACFRPISIGQGPVILGRKQPADVVIEDEAVSTRHVRVAFDGETWTFEDLKSRNHTYVDGEPIAACTTASARTLLLGQSVLLVVRNIGALGTGPELIDGRMIAGAAMRAVLQQLEPAANEGAPILLLGETGTGKEQVARWCHRHGRHASGAFVDIDVGGLTDDLAPSLLFGAMRGSHSTATRDSKGYYEQASGGVLFFDELANMPLGVQAKNLRVLQERCVRPLGATHSIAVDIDVCSATNRDLEEMIREGRFLHDLHFRLAHAVVSLPPLRERLEEIPFLIDRMCAARQSMRGPSAEFVMRALLHVWPGNVRELDVVVGRAMRDATKPQLRAVHVPRTVATKTLATTAPSAPAPAPPTTERSKTIDALERERILEALEENDFHVTNAARALGMHRQTLASKIREYGLRAERKK